MFRGSITPFIFIFTLSISSNLPAIEKAKSCQAQRKTIDANLTVDSEYFDGNTIFCWCQNDGMIVSHRIDGYGGMKWPGSTKNKIDYASGLWLMGKTIFDEIRSASSEYGTEFNPGTILPDGTPADPNDPAFRIYKINADGSGDWDVWPFDQGAPALKANNGLDSLDAYGNRTPLLLGNQTLFWVMNDADWDRHGYLFSTKPMGLEIQVLIFGYNEPDYLKDVMFIQWKIINKSENAYHSCYAGIFDDCDLGSAIDDFTGCDTTLGLGYTYNGHEFDAVYKNIPPALGSTFLLCPSSNSKQLKMTSFISYT